MARVYAEADSLSLSPLAASTGAVAEKSVASKLSFMPQSGKVRCRNCPIHTGINFINCPWWEISKDKYWNKEQFPPMKECGRKEWKALCLLSLHHCRHTGNQMNKGHGLSLILSHTQASVTCKNTHMQLLANALTIVAPTTLLCCSICPKKQS